MGVNKVNLANGETLIDLTSDTVSPSTLAKGYTAHNSNGEQIVGEMTEEGGSGDCNFVVSTVFDISTMTIPSISHTYDEIQSAIQEGKQVLFKSNYGLGIAYGSLVSTQTNMMCFQLMIQANFGDGAKLYYFSILLYSDNRTSVYPFIVNTTALGG